MIGTRPLPETIQARLLAGPELVKNLVCLGKLFRSRRSGNPPGLSRSFHVKCQLISGKSGTIDTDGISLGFLGGLPTENVDSVRWY